jgi:hypothetical protein
MASSMTIAKDSSLFVKNPIESFGMPNATPSQVGAHNAREVALSMRRILLVLSVAALSVNKLFLASWFRRGQYVGSLRACTKGG